VAGGGGEDGEGGTPEAGGRRDVGCGGGEDERGWGAGGKEAAEGEGVEAERGVRSVAEEEEHGGGGGGRERGGDGDRREVGPLGLGAVGGERGGCSDCVRMGSVDEELGGGVGGGVSAACAGGGGHGEPSGAWLVTWLFYTSDRTIERADRARSRSSSSRWRRREAARVPVRVCDTTNGPMDHGE